MDVKEAWDSIDIDGDGHLDRDEIANVLALMGQSNMSSEELDAAIDMFDTDGDGQIDFDEFKNWRDRRLSDFQQNGHLLSDDVLRQKFKQIDVNGQPLVQQMQALSQLLNFKFVR